MRLGGDVDRPRVVEHRRLERHRGERADLPNDRLRVRDELLVAHLEVTGGADAPTERTRVADLLPPQARELSRRRADAPRCA